MLEVLIIEAMAQVGDVEMTSLRRNIGKAIAKAYVGENLVCSGKLMFALVQK